MTNRRFFTGEAVAAGHPDKLCDGISASVTDLQLILDYNARISAETKATRNYVSVDCEVKSDTPVTNDDIEKVVKDKIKQTGYDGTVAWQPNNTEGWWLPVPAREIDIHVDVAEQSPEISAGVADGGAGDQGMMFGFAKHSPHTEHMPETIWYCNRIMEKYDDLRLNDEHYGVLGPDAKCQLTLEYVGGRVRRVDTVVISAFHSTVYPDDVIEHMLTDLVQSVLPENWLDSDTKWHVNPAGPWFDRCGPAADIGLTGRKIIVDAYGGHCPHGGGAFSGKDPSKVDVTGAYAARYLAKNLVHAGYGHQCQVQISYAIGIAEPQSIYIDVTEPTVMPEKLQQIESELLRGSKSSIMDLTPNGIIDRFDLKRPIYERASAYGHFGRKAEDGYFPWENLDLQI